jgi:pheromone shutdown protein TraB
MPVGLSEAWLRRPTVADCEAINEDVQSLRGIYKNRFTRVLLVALLSTFGAAIGAWTGIGWVWSLAGQ